MKYIVQGDFSMDIPHTLVVLIPSRLLQFRGSSKEIIVGTLLKRYINTDSRYTGIVKRSSISGGVFYRNIDAAIVQLVYEHQEQYTIGFSYDINLSALSGAPRVRGGPEISLRYTPPNAFLYQMKKKR